MSNQVITENPWMNIQLYWYPNPTKNKQNKAKIKKILKVIREFKIIVYLKSGRWFADTKEEQIKEMGKKRRRDKINDVFVKACWVGGWFEDNVKMLMSINY